jgi:hypothetical protein
MGASFWRPFVCPECAHAFRVMRPFGQSTLLGLVGFLTGMLSIRLFTFPYYLFALGVLTAALWAIDASLLGRTARLSPVLPRSRAPEA